MSFTIYIFLSLATVSSQVGRGPFLVSPPSDTQSWCSLTGALQILAQKERTGDRSYTGSKKNVCPDMSSAPSGDNMLGQIKHIATFNFIVDGDIQCPHATRNTKRNSRSAYSYVTQDLCVTCELTSLKTRVDMASAPTPYLSLSLFSFYQTWKRFSSVTRKPNQATKHKNSHVLSEISDS